MNNERTTSQNIALVFTVLSLVVSAILIGAIIVSANNSQRTEELRKELHQCWSEKLNE